MQQYPFPPARTLICLYLLLLPTLAKEPESVVITEGKRLCNFKCKECLESDSNICTRCPEGLFLNQGSCQHCDSKCLSSSFCSQTGCLKCQTGYFSSASAAHGGAFRCFKQKPLAEVPWKYVILVLLSLVLAVILIKAVKKLGDKDEEEYLYIAESRKEIPSNVIVRGKSDLNIYFNDQVWMDI